MSNIKVKNISLLLLATALSSHAAAALTPNAISNYSNAYIFIENNIDREYFVAAKDLDPRFSGANIWTKFSTNQVSRGYMGVNWGASNQNVDIWLDNPFVNYPFEGLRCTKGNGCPATGFYTAELVDEKGFYKAKSGSGIIGGAYGFASFSSNAYEALRNAAVGSSYTSNLNYCYTRQDYDPNKGERCATTATSGTWRRAAFTHAKAGNISLNDTKGASEIWVAADGKPSLSEKSEFCEESIVGGVNGMTCKMVHYTYKGSEPIFSRIYFKMIVDNKALGFTPSAADIKFSGDKANWSSNYSSEVQASTVFRNSNDYIYMFLSQKFFTALIKNGGSIDKKDDVFTFNFRNTATPESGFYQFSTSTKVDILPREYGISIRPDKNSLGLKTGKIGSKDKIEFDYKVTISAPKMADTVTAQVLGQSEKKKNLNYCKFSPADKSYAVLIPSYLSYTTAVNDVKNLRNSCGDNEVSIKDAAWSNVAWDVQKSGYFYSTLIKLWFPMDDDVSTMTTSGESWQGTVFANGEVKVKALWIGVNKR